MPRMEATMLLCDAAEQQGGKLYILGGGWSLLHAPDAPVNMALAVKLAVPWTQTNEPHSIRVALLTEDGDAVDLGQGPVQVEAKLEVGRPAGLKPGTPIDAPFVVPFTGISLGVGGYVWVLTVDGTELARTPFRVVG
jgi:hypothetical protein